MRRARRRRDPFFDLNTGDVLLEAETIIQDVARRRRRVFGPAHPATLEAENEQSLVGEALSEKPT